MSEFWGGENIKKPVKRLDAESWEELYTNYFQTGVPCQYTRSEYGKLDKAAKLEVKLGAYVTACSFKEGTTQRTNENAKDLQLIVLDIDKHDEAMALFSLSDSILNRMGGINYLVHTTISHTNIEPKLRVLVEVEPCDLKHREKLTNHVAELLGVSQKGGYDKCSTVTSQAFFRPVNFADDTKSAVISSQVTGSPLSEYEVREVSEGKKPEEKYLADIDDFDLSDLENLPLPICELKWVEKALSYIDPDEEDESGNSYIPWFKICCALKHQYRTTSEAKEAYKLFDDWSSLGIKYVSSADTLRKWQSFKAAPKGVNPVTMRTLFQRAISKGWDSSEMTGKIQLSFSRWLEEVTDKNIIANEGLNRIASTPFKDSNGIIQNDMVAKLKARMTELGLKGVTEAELKRQLRKEKVKVSVKEKTDDRPAWLLPWCYLCTSNIFFNTLSKAELCPSAFNSMFSKYLMPDPEEGESNMSGKPYALPTDYANNVKCIDTAYGMTYDPSFGGDKTYIKIDNMTYVNRYRPPNVAPVKSQAKKAEKLLRLFFRTLIDDEFIENYLFDMIAFACQNTDKKVRIATLFQSVEGAGKTMFGSILANVFGEHNTKQVNATDLDSGFNSYAADTHLLILEELHASGQNRKKVMDVLKEVISNDYISVTEKYKNPMKVANKMLVFGFTNHVDAISITPNDRRYFCIKLKPTLREVEEQSKSGYFEEISRLKNVASKDDKEGFEGLAGGVVYFFRHFEVSPDFDPNARAPKTEYRSELIASSKNPLLALIEDVIYDGDIDLASNDIIATTFLDQEILKTDRSMKIARVPHYLKELGFYLFRKGNLRRFCIGGVKTSVWVHKSRYKDEAGDAITQLVKRFEADSEKNINFLLE